MKARLVLGIMLVVSGLVVLSYFSSPIRFLMLAYDPHPVDVNVPIAGLVLLICGMAILFVSRERKS
jgi:hypothetical protein